DSRVLILISGSTPTPTSGRTPAVISTKVRPRFLLSALGRDSGEHYPFQQAKFSFLSAGLRGHRGHGKLLSYFPLSTAYCGLRNINNYLTKVRRPLRVAKFLVASTFIIYISSSSLGLLQ